MRNRLHSLMGQTACAAVLLALTCGGASAQHIQAQEFVLDNGMKFLVIPRKGDPNVAAGWIARVGSVNERPGITGIAHLFEHMMFKGTTTIGVKDFDLDRQVREQMDAVRADLRKEEEDQIRRLRLGEISDLNDPTARSPKHQELLTKFQDLQQKEKALLVTNEFDRLYTSNGASGMNAGTDHDYTIYFINVPANKLELWFWMESDRLANAVFREFYSERDVVKEERRMRTDSTPIGRYQEQFDSLFWTASPYGWPVVGWMSDLDGITREEALQFFSMYYAPNNLTACLVGDLDPVQAKALAERYFGRLKRSPVSAPPVRTREPESLAERRMVAYAETNPQVEIRYQSVADGHRDEPALVVLGALLNGRTGRLYKSLVLDQKIATSAGSGQNGYKWEGYFSLNAVARPGTAPEQVEQALYQELDKLRTTKVEDRELQKVKNQFAADNFRRVQSNFALMVQLLLADSNRGWQSFNDDPKRIDGVTADDVQRVVNTYFQSERRGVALYYTRQESDGAEPDPLTAGLSDEERAQVKQLQGMVQQASVEKVRAMLQQLESQESATPPEKRPMLAAIKAVLQQRLDKEKGGKPGPLPRGVGAVGWK